MKQIFKGKGNGVDNDYISIYTKLYNTIEIETTEDYHNDEEPIQTVINLNKEQAIEMANAILKHYNS